MTEKYPYIYCNIEYSIEQALEKEKELLFQCPSGRLSYTYLIECRGKFYIGKHTCKNEGMLPHNDKNYLSSSRCKEFKSIPREEKKKYILGVFLTSEEALNHEIILHAQYKVAKNELFWNKAEQKSKRFCYSGLGANHPMYGKKHTEEARKKQSEIKKGKKRSLESRKKQSKTLKGRYKGEKSPNFGRKHTKETCKNISESNKGRKRTAETCKNISESLKGSKNPSYDSTLRDWQHKDGEKELQITNYDFYKKYKLHQGNVCAVAKGKGKSKSVGGWSCLTVAL